MNEPPPTLSRLLQTHPVKRGERDCTKRRLGVGRRPSSSSCLFDKGHATKEEEKEDTPAAAVILHRGTHLVVIEIGS